MRDTASEDEAAAAFGLAIDGRPDETVWIWPENWVAVTIFADLMTQWNMGHSGPVGIRYESIPVVLRMRGVPRGQWSELFEGLRVMEGEALRVFAEKRAAHG